MAARVIIGLVAFVVMLYCVDFQTFVEAIRSANYGLLLASFYGSMLWLAVRAQVWRVLLQNKASYRDAFLTMCDGYLMNNVLPFSLGEVGRAFLLGRKSKLDFMGVLPTIIIERDLDLAFAAVILLSAVPFVVGAAGAGPRNTMSIWNEFGMLLEKLLSKPVPVKRGDWRPGDQKVFVADIRKAECALG